MSCVFYRITAREKKSGKYIERERERLDEIGRKREFGVGGM